MILFKGKTSDIDTVFPPTLRLDGQLCVRNGVSTRGKFLIGIYDVALYLSQMTEDARTAITSNSNKQIRMVARRSIKGTFLGKAFKDGLKANCSAQEFSQYESLVDSMFGNLFATDTIKEGEIFVIDFSPTQGVRLSSDRFTDLPYISVEGFDQALLKIWIGDHPVSQEMKQELLGTKV